MFSYNGNSYQLGYDKFDNRATQLALVPYPKTELFQLFDPMVYGFFLLVIIASCESETLSDESYIQLS